MGLYDDHQQHEEGGDGNSLCGIQDRLGRAQGEGGRECGRGGVRDKETRSETGLKRMVSRGTCWRVEGGVGRKGGLMGVDALTHLLLQMPEGIP